MTKRRKITPEVEALIPELISEWRRLTKLAGPNDHLQTREFRSTVSNVEILRQAFTTDPSVLGENYFSKTDLLASYLLYFWPLHYQETLSILGELHDVPGRVLDISSGPCASAFAALKFGASEVIATDQNIRALELGARLAGHAGYPLTIREWNPLKGKCPVQPPFDAIILSHSLFELFPVTEKSRLDAFILSLLDMLTKEGRLILIESSEEPFNSSLLKLRDRLVEQQVPVQAPCVWQGQCPALINQFPCFAQREYEKPFLMKEIQRGADIHLSSLKISYLILRPKVAGWPKPAVSECYRVVSPRFKNEFEEFLFLCGTPGKKKLSRRLNTDSKVFQYLKRGDLIATEDAHVSEKNIQVTENTKLNVVAACGKPLPEVFSSHE